MSEHMTDTPKTVQIPYNTFIDLCSLLNGISEDDVLVTEVDRLNRTRDAINAKLALIVKRHEYSKRFTASK